ncbi:HK97 gp10 family phage protein [Solibacillus sp. FSL H8-0523]|uniref:HK97 gp10 family phage protein n=1 Tax=Solibacillus sp. FSL H8-0523 TaxID=2954511 RepID=UPI0031013B77
MARWGRVDISQLKRMQKKMERLERAGFDKFCEDAAKELAARMLSKVIKRTPVGQYDDGRVGGTLRRGWTIKTDVRKVGNVYEVEVINPTEYAQYVEFGHRTSNHQGWVNGRFMMTISADEVERAAPAILERKLMNLLKEAFDGN